jgi:hypothetical protein
MLMKNEAERYKFSQENSDESKAAFAANIDFSKTSRVIITT